MTQVLVKKKDGSWALWDNGHWTPTAPPVLSPPEDSAAKASADPLDALVQAVLREVQLPRASPEARRRLGTVDGPARSDRPPRPKRPRPSG